MKTIKTYGSLMLAGVLMLGSVSIMNAQGRGNGRDNNPGRGHQRENPGRGHEKHVDKHHDDRKFESRDRDRDSRRDNDRRDEARGTRERDGRRDYSFHDRDHHTRYVTYNYHRYRRPMWAPVYGYRYNTRYIYYNDYNVYYDCHRDVFLTWTGRRWVITHRIPDFMLRVDFRNTVVSGVDYWDDDFDFYLERRRPAFVSIRAEF